MFTQARWGDAEHTFVTALNDGRPCTIPAERLALHAIDGGIAPYERDFGDATAEVDAERDRRTDAGIIFAGKLFQTRPQDRENIAGASQLATMALILGGKQPGDLHWHDGEAPFAWIAADNSLVPMDAPSVIGFARAAAARKSVLIYAGRAIKDRIAAGEAIPDVTDDALWPPIE